VFGSSTDYLQLLPNVDFLLGEQLLFLQPLHQVIGVEPSLDVCSDIDHKIMQQLITRLLMNIEDEVLSGLKITTVKPILLAYRLTC